MTAAARSPAREAGMSLVELMVGMLVGLIGIIIITHLYLTNEDYKRSTTGAGTAQVNGAIALYVLERDVRMSGYGLNSTGALGCKCDTVANPDCSPVQYFYDGKYSAPPGAPGPNILPKLEFTPVLITETPGQPDSISVLYSRSADRALPDSLAEAMPSPSAELKASSPTGYHEGDLIVVANGETCAMMALTQVQSNGNLQHNPTSLWNPVGGGSLLPAFPANSFVYNLGDPTWRVYSVSQGRLRLTDMATGAVTAPVQDLVDDIVDLQAQYGKDTNNDGTVDTWNSVKPTSAAEWAQVQALRIAVLARSPNYIKPTTPGGNCYATSPAELSPPAPADKTYDNVPTWTDGAGVARAFPAVDFDTATSEARCYQYRVFETVVPLRNMIWRPA